VRNWNRESKESSESVLQYLYLQISYPLKMAALIKKAPALLNTAKELALPRLNTFWRYAKVELSPPSPGELPAAIADISTKLANVQKQSFRNWTVNQTVLNVVVGSEILCWFFIGECIGKGSLVGYQV